MPARRKKSLLQNKVQDERTGRPHREHRAKRGRRHDIHKAGTAKYKVTKQMSANGFNEKDIRKETRGLLFLK